MRALFITITTMALVLSGAVSTAQTITAPALGATSPLGVPGTQTQIGTGIPLGATEIDPLSSPGMTPGGTIPLGAIDIPNAGISPTITVPPPSASCPQPMPGSASGC